MPEHTDAAQARVFVELLMEHIERVSVSLERAEARARRARADPHSDDEPDARTLREELYELHRMVDRLHRRFPRAPGADRRDDG